jgi:tetratricopeptide (TPR) repeat protein
MIHRTLLLVALALTVPLPSPLVLHADEKNAQDAKATAYSPAEYNQYIAAAQNKTSELRLAALDRFLAQYRHSGLLPFACETYYSTYNELKNYAKVIEYADRFLALGDKTDPVARLRALAARTRAFELSYSDTDANNQPRLQEARDAAIRAIALVDQIPKPENTPTDRFEQEKRATRAFYQYAVGFADLELKDYDAAVQPLQFAATANEKDPITFFRLGIAELRMSPPAYLEGFWALARSVALNGSNGAQVRTYLKDQLLRYQQCACENVADDEVTRLVAKAANQAAPPADLEIPSADELQKVRESAGPILDELRTNDEHAQRVWLAVCGLEFPEVTIKVLAVAQTNNLVILQAFRGRTSEEMQKATEPNMEIRIAAQPGVERLKPGDWVRFHGALTALQHDPFLLTWDSAHVNSEDIPQEVVNKTRKRSLRRQQN